MDSINAQLDALSLKVQDLYNLALLELKSRSDLLVKFLHQNPYTKEATLSIKANYKFVDQYVRNYDYESVDWKFVIAVALGTIFVWETFLEIRQRFALSVKELPEELKGVADQKVYDKSRTYNIQKWNFKLFCSVYGMAQTCLIIYFNLYAVLWYNIGKQLDSVGYGNQVILQSCSFMYILFLISSVLSLPTKWYSTFVIEARNGFNKTTYGTFILDEFKTLFLIMVIGMPFLAGGLAIIDWAGKDFTFYIFMFVTVFQLFILMIFPTVIAPLFNTFIPLSEGTLKTKIDALAAKFKFPLTKVFVVDGSRRSAHSNAYFFGLFKNKRIVLYDTLVDKTSEEEIVAVLGHELGHWYHNHILDNLIVSEIHVYVLFKLFSLCLNLDSLYESFGFVEKPVLIGFLLFQYLFTVVEELFSFGINYIIRRNEYQADAFAKKHGYSKELQSALKKLFTDNLSVMNPDWMYVAWHHSHPPLVQRIKALNKK